jgi:hypothetical protein
MHKKLLLLSALVFWPSYSYSDSIAPWYGYTGNAITDQSLRWSMPGVLPGAPGLDIDNVIYSYRINKETGEHVDVYVYNENANGTGYIFREHDEWKPGSLSGTQINKVVPLGRLHRDLFGPGGIDVEGNGSVSDANVVYTYRVDPCYDPQFDPNCPGYQIQIPNIEVPEYDIYDALASGDADQDRWNPIYDEEYDEEKQLTYEEKKKQEEEEEKDRKQRLEDALTEAGRSALFAEALAASMLTDSMQINLNSYTNKTINGGVYNDTIVMADKTLSDSKNGLRNGLAQQILHQQMVEMQYGLQ